MDYKDVKQKPNPAEQAETDEELPTAADAAEQTGEAADLEPEDGAAEPETPVTAAEKKYDALNQRYLRMLAEYDNFRKRSQREKEAAFPAAVASTVEKFLPVVDNFERAMEFECADAEFKKGLGMIDESLKSALAALGVEPVGQVGDTFDANLHNAVMHVEDDAFGAHVVSAVLQKGYRIGDRVLRYAMVTVAN